MILRRSCAMFLVVALSGGCGASEENSPQVDTESKPATVSATLSPPARTTAAPMESRVTPDDARLIDAFVAFALDPDASTAGRLPLSPEGVRLGLGRDLLQELPLGQAHDPSSWRIRTPTYFRAYEGPFSVLQSVRSHVKGGSANSQIRTSGDIQMSLGEHPHCASPPVPPPQGLEDMRRVSLQPADESITTCLAWFTADLFLDRDRDLVAVTMDLWEP